MRKLKLLGISLSVCAVSFAALYFSALIIIPSCIDLNKFKASVSEELEKQTGFKINCEDIHFIRSYTPYLKIHMYHTIVLYPDDEVFLKLREADLKIKVLPLFLKRIVIKDAKLTRPIVNITLYKDFSTSLEKYIDISKPVMTNGFKLDVLIVNTLCERYKLKIKDESISKIFYLEGDELLLKDIKLNEKAHLILKGALFENQKEYLKYDIDIISSLKNKTKQFDFSPFKQIYESDIKGNIYGHLNIDKNNLITGSLKVNDISLKIDDVTLTDNKAEFEFNGNEVNINSELHTSNSDIALLKGKFCFGKKQKIDLSVNAKKINIENLVKIVTSVCESLNIKNCLKDIDVKGLLNADFNINSDFVKLKSTGTAKIIDAGVQYKQLPYALTGINADLDFNNNNIIIKKAIANINKTPVNLNGVINEDVSYDLKLSADKLNIADVISLFKFNKKLPVIVNNGFLEVNSEIQGKLNKSFNAKTLININSLKLRHKESNIPLIIDSAAVNINSNDKKYSGDILCNNFAAYINKEKIKAEKVSVLFDDKKITIKEGIISVPGIIKLNGIINNYTKNPTGNIQFNGNIPSSSAAGILKNYIQMPYKAVGNINSAGEIIIADDKINLKTQMQANKNNYLSYIVIKELLNKPSLLNIDFDINKNTLFIKDISLMEDNSNVILTELKTGLEKIKKIVKITGTVIKEKELILKNIKVNIPEALTVSTNFFGGEEISLSADIILNKTLKLPEVTGEAKIHKYNIKRYLTAVKNADVSFADNNIRIIAPDVQVNNSHINIVADILPDYSFKNIVVSNMQLNALNLDLNSFFSMIEKERNPFMNSIITVKKGIATINNFKILDLSARDISNDFSIENNILKIFNISAKAYNGNVSGRADYDFSNGLLNLNLSGSGLDIKNSLYDLCKISDNLLGQADFNANISLLTGDYKKVINSLNGKVSFNAKNGRMGTLGKFEYYLYAQNLIYHGILNATLNRIANTIVHDNTAQYRESQGTLFLQNGYLITEEIKTIGSNMSLYMKGRHNLLTNMANIDIYGRISDEITSKLGSFGDVSISEMINASQDKKDVTILRIPGDIIEKIPNLYNQGSRKTNTFKVNIYGNINSLNAINSFMWIVSDNTQKETNQELLPDFDDMMQDL